MSRMPGSMSHQYLSYGASTALMEQVNMGFKHVKRISYIAYRACELLAVMVEYSTVLRHLM